VGIAACPPNTPPVHGVVTFDPAVFIVSYPMFATVDPAALTLNFTLATLALNNSCRSIVIDAAVREVLLNLLTAHITALLNGVNGAPPAGIVGRISTATEGTVSVSAEYIASASASWFIQTQWGAMFWQLTLQYRTFRYIPAPNACGPGSRFGWPGIGGN